jgi:uncharacterized membrane protein YdfJ with MMPL/SSD domain
MGDRNELDRVSSLSARFAATIERRAPWIIAAWIVAAVVMTLVAPSLNDVGSQDTADFLPGDAPSQQADRLLAERFPDDPTREAAIIVIARDGGLRPGDQAYVKDLVEDLRSSRFSDDISGVQTAASDPALAAFLRSKDGSAELIVASMRRAPFSTTGTAAIENLRHHLELTAPSELDAHVTGLAGLAADQAQGVIESFDRTAIVTVILVLIILLLIYRSVVAALIPLVTIGLAFGVSNGLVAYLADAGLKVNTMVGTFLVVMIFGAGTDYCLFLTSRYREDLALGEPVPATVIRTMKVIGAVITASAATVIVGFMSMITADFGIFKTMGPAIGIAIGVTLVAGLTLTPAMLRMAGKRAFWPRQLDEVRRSPALGSDRWTRIANVIEQRSAAVLLAGLAALAIPAAGLGWYAQSFDLVHDLPVGADARLGFDRVSEHFPGGTISPVYLIVTTPEPILDDANLAAIDGLTDWLRAQPGIAEVRSVTQPAGAPLTTDNIGSLTGGDTDLAALGLDESADLTPFVRGLSSPRGLRLTGPLLRQFPELTKRLGLLLGTDAATTRLVVSLDGNPYDNEALDVITGIKADARAEIADTELADAEVAVGGPSSFYADMRKISNDDFKVMVVVILAAIFVVLALLLRSLVAPIYLLATVVLSYAATMGITVAVFQGLLGEAGITFWLAPFLFVILVALGADYNIFIMSRIREEADAGHEIHDAVKFGVTLTGRVITSAGLILAGTFAALLLAPLPNLRQIGFGVTVGILIDTFIVRSLVVPSATMLLGRCAFWPRSPGPARTRPPDPQIAVRSPSSDRKVAPARDDVRLTSRTGDRP